MEHPYFDVLVFPFHREEAKALHKVLSQAQDVTGRINILYKQSGANLPPLTLPAAPDLVWDEALKNLTANRALRTFCNLIKAEFAAQEIITNAILAIEQAVSASEVKIYSNDIFILDCEPHRTAVSQITSDTTAAKVLLVRGPSKSGKSHCRYIFQSIAEDKGASVVYLYDGIITTVKDTIEYIFSTLGVSAKDVPPQGLTSDEAWYKAVCTELKKVATSQKQKVWIVVDDLGYVEKVDALGNIEIGGPILDTRIRAFFEQFALFMLDPSFVRYFRLLLIHYSEKDAPTKWKTQMWVETKTDEKDIQQKHVEEFVKSWAEGNKELKMLDQDIKNLAAEVIAKADTPPHEPKDGPRLQRIHDTLKSKLDDVLKKIP